MSESKKVNKVITPEEFHELYKNDRLEELTTRESYWRDEINVRHVVKERYFDMNTIWEQVLKQEISVPKILPESISSVIIFGSTVNRKLYDIIPGKKHKFLKWEWSDKDKRKLHLPNDLDICVLTNQEYEDTTNSIKSGDLDYPAEGPIMGNLHINYVPTNKFVEFLNNNAETASAVYKNGVIICDDGAFQDVIMNQFNPREKLYNLEWTLKDRVTRPGIFGVPAIIKKDVLHGKLIYNNP